MGTPEQVSIPHLEYVAEAIEAAIRATPPPIEITINGQLYTPPDDPELIKKLKDLENEKTA